MLYGNHITARTREQTEERPLRLNVLLDAGSESVIPTSGPVDGLIQKPYNQ